MSNFKSRKNQGKLHFSPILLQDLLSKFFFLNACNLGQSNVDLSINEYYL